MGMKDLGTHRDQAGPGGPGGPFADASTLFHQPQGGPGSGRRHGGRSGGLSAHCGPRERERGSRAPVRGGGEGLQPGPHLPPPQHELLGCPSPWPQAWGGWCCSVPLPVSPPHQPPEWGGTHGDRALPAVVCVGRGGRVLPPPWLPHAPSSPMGKKWWGVKEGRGEREKDSDRERGAPARGGGYGGGAAAPGPPGQWEPPLT